MSDTKIINALPLTIPVNHDNYYRSMLDILKAVEPFSKMRERELDVLSEIMRYNYEYKDIPREDRMIIIFNYNTRARIANNLGISKEVLYNVMKALRDKGFITTTDIVDKWEAILGSDPRVGINFNFKYE